MCSCHRLFRRLDNPEGKPVTPARSYYDHDFPSTFCYQATQLFLNSDLVSIQPLPSYEGYSAHEHPMRLWRWGCMMKGIEVMYPECINYPKAGGWTSWSTTKEPTWHWLSLIWSSSLGMDRFTLNRFLPIPILTDFENFNLTDTDTDTENWITYRYRYRLNILKK